MLQCVGGCDAVCVAVGCSAFGKARIEYGKRSASRPKQAFMINESVCCSALQYVAVCCSVFQCVAEFGGHTPSHCKQACIMYESCRV